MNQDKLIAMAKEAGFNTYPTENMLFTVRGNYTQLQSFAKLIRKEQVALDSEVAESAASDDNKYDIADAIRNQEIQ